MTTAGAPAADPAGDGKATCAAGTSIAMAGALTGADTALGINVMDGVQLAVDQHNKANPGCQVTMKPFDTEGDAQKATAGRAADRSTIIRSSGWSARRSPVRRRLSVRCFERRRVWSSLTASATNATLTQNGWKTFFRGLANDDVQGPSVAKYMMNTAGFKKVCVIQDNTDYGDGPGQAVTDGLGPVADSACASQVKKGDKDFSATVTKVAAETGRGVLRRLLLRRRAVGPAAQGRRRDRDVRLRRRHQRPAVRPAGGRLEQGRDAVLPVRPGAPAVVRLRVRRTKFSDPASTRSRATTWRTILLKGIDSGMIDAGPSMLDFVRTYDGQGLPGSTSGQPTVSCPTP